MKRGLILIVLQADTSESLNIPVCTESDNLRFGFWEFIQKIDYLPYDVIEALKKASLSSSPSPDLIQIFEINSFVPVHVTEALYKYNENDCSEAGLVRRYLWDFIKNFIWSSRAPKSLRVILKSINEKDKVLPSDCLVHRLESYVGKGILTENVIHMLRQMRFCVEASNGVTCPDVPSTTPLPTTTSTTPRPTTTKWTTTPRSTTTTAIRTTTQCHCPPEERTTTTARTPPTCPCTTEETNKLTTEEERSSRSA